MALRTPPNRAKPDKIFTFSDLLEEPRIRRPWQQLGINSHQEYLSFYYEHNHGVGLPIPPANPDELRRATVLVDKGRWGWQCPDCGVMQPVEPGEQVAICVECGSDEWIRVERPAHHAAIEAELLKQPGHRLNSPIRDWEPAWSISDLEDRTRRASEKAANGERVISLSIPSTRAWAPGEILTAGNMETSINALLNALAGRPAGASSAIIEVENSFQLPNHAGTFLGLSRLVTALRPGGLLGRLIGNTSKNVVEIFSQNGWIPIGAYIHAWASITVTNNSNSNLITSVVASSSYGITSAGLPFHQGGAQARPAIRVNFTEPVPTQHFEILFIPTTESPSPPNWSITKTSTTQWTVGVDHPGFSPGQSRTFRLAILASP